jgi:hypothetical protein
MILAASARETTVGVQHAEPETQRVRCAARCAHPSYIANASACQLLLKGISHLP